MSNFHGRIMNIRDGADGAASIEYKRGHRDARHAAAEIANEADSRIAELEAQLAAAQAEVTRLRELNRELASEENHFQEQEAAHSGEGE